MLVARKSMLRRGRAHHAVEARAIVLAIYVHSAAHFVLSVLRAEVLLCRRQNGQPRRFTSDDVIRQRSHLMAADSLRQLRTRLYYDQNIRQFLLKCLSDPFEECERHCRRVDGE
ncbi:uncharacterized protein LAESUDRAFT_307575 [Laetiporus sulphureus 93-53]|uniref:Uncharacterized protein n=1 Tax=Laetiporus sulphureus 93-53 TaxID=1314785 RepID=A0A165D9I9_9APHY|nr:uncharacterized protein LAESUDRAFT_307575 [Laetiporus sulphureus 93-53]KZT04385.1 hypothetical protein LAESUDRAFT_307575 [Laetiporus sulphureus 93-53]